MFYTSFSRIGNNILYRGYENGKQVKKRIPYKPYLFIETKDENSTYKTLTGKSVEKIYFNDFKDVKETLSYYEGTDQNPYHGQDLRSLHYVYIFDKFRNEIQYDPELIRIVYLDIEVDSSDGFPSPDKASSKITAISLAFKEGTISFGYKPYKSSDNNIKYIRCKDELELLTKFAEVWSSIQPDVVTGWNIESFDIPYLIRRIKNLGVESIAKKLSPWGIVDEKTVSRGKSNGVFNVYEIKGVSALDYLQLYKKFMYTNQESYRLDHIAFVELGEKKLQFDGTLHDLYENDFQTFIDYNVKDVHLVQRLDDKLKLIELVYAMAYSAKVNYVDTFGVVGIWDTIAHNYLLEKNIVTPRELYSIPYEIYNAETSLPEEDKRGGVVADTAVTEANRYAVKVIQGSFLGGYVKTPEVGMHDWVCSFDLNSLYPHLIMQYNISPETYVKQIEGIKDIDAFLNGEANSWDTDLIKTPNRCLFRRDIPGFFPELMELYYEKRTIYKKKMIECQKEYEKNKSFELQKQIAKYNNLQMAFKILLNSAYGAFGNQYYRYYQRALAECITMAGQISIRWVENAVNKYLNETLKTDKDYVIASDTDSIYINMSGLVNKVYDDPRSDIPGVVDFLDKVCTKAIEPLIDKSYDELCAYTNAYAQKMKMKRESIADKGIWTAKKRYILNVHDSEGVRYSEPKLKMMGIEAVKSSTPAACRNSIKEALSIIMRSDNEELLDYVQNFKEQFINLDYDDIAFPRSCNNLNKFFSAEKLYQKATPIHVKGALLYNHILETKGLEKKYERIHDGDKIKFCHLHPNKYGLSVISSPGVVPKEFDLDKYIDRETQFEKAFIEPLKGITDKINWKIERNLNTLEDLFG